MMLLGIDEEPLRKAILLSAHVPARAPKISVVLGTHFTTQEAQGGNLSVVAGKFGDL